jgi:hypothetical protein
MNFTTNPQEANILNRVSVRLIPERGPDRDRFDELLRTKHYLKSDRIGGRHLRYVAEVEGEWVAMASFSGAAPHLKAREQWIGWAPELKVRRLGMVVNNSRFLVLTDRKKIPNMASKVLSMCLRRLRDDWEKRWNASVLIVESFVDETLHLGTSYKACGFEMAGMTAGFSKDSRDFYIEHGRIKRLYLKELITGARDILKSKKLSEDLVAQESPERPEPPKAERCEVTPTEFRSLVARLCQLEDPRTGAVRHRVASTLACAAAAMLMGSKGYQGCEDKCKLLSQLQLRGLRCYRDKKTKRYVAPSDTTFFRVMNLVNPEQFEAIVSQWLLDQKPTAIDRIAVDGKVLRGSAHGDKKALGLLSAVAHQSRITLKSVPIEEKSNEIPAIKPLLENLNIQGKVITADAMHCQQETARFINQECGGEYFFGLKGNQEGVLELAKNKLSGFFFSKERT